MFAALLARLRYRDVLFLRPGNPFRDHAYSKSAVRFGAGTDIRIWSSHKYPTARCPSRQEHHSGVRNNTAYALAQTHPRTRLRRAKARVCAEGPRALPKQFLLSIEDRRRTWSERTQAVPPLIQTF